MFHRWYKQSIKQNMGNRAKNKKSTKDTPNTPPDSPPENSDKKHIINDDMVTTDEEVFIFYENKKIKAIYTDKSSAKKDILNYLVKFHLDRKFAQTKKDCVKLLYKKLSSLLDPSQNYMDSMGHNWNLVKLNRNHIYETVNTPGYKTKYTKLNIKALNINRRDLDKEIDYLPLHKFYN